MTVQYSHFVLDGVGIQPWKRTHPKEVQCWSWKVFSSPNTIVSISTVAQCWQVQQIVNNKQKSSATSTTDWQVRGYLSQRLTFHMATNTNVQNFLSLRLQTFQRYFKGCKILKVCMWPWSCPFRGWFAIGRLLWSTYVPNLTSLTSPIMKRWMTMYWMQIYVSSMSTLVPYTIYKIQQVICWKSPRC